MQPFSLLIKPASADCNLNCPYCFYLNRSNLYPDVRKHRMDNTVLERLINGYLKTDQPIYTFLWQGGEPTLMGLPFFRQIVELQQKHGRNGSRIANGLQTNATLINDKFAAYLANYNFLVGLSLDGPPEIHDYYRINRDGKGSHKQVLRSMECLRKNRVEFNALTLVSSANVHRGREVYRYLRDLGVSYHQYIPCVEFDEQGKPCSFAITGEAWGTFLCAIFDEWLKADAGRISVRLFDSLLSLMLEDTRNICQINDDCCQYFVVEYNGDVYPCDFFVRSDKKIGNIMKNSWENLQKSPAYLSFGKEKTQWNEKCGQCNYLWYCKGDCLKYRGGYLGSNPTALSWLCPGWQQFYQHSLSSLQTLANQFI